MGQTQNNYPTNIPDPLVHNHAPVTCIKYGLTQCTIIDCLQFIYAEQLSVFVAKTTMCWQNKDWIFYNRIHNMLLF
jgi:hypothetical protein